MNSQYKNIKKYKKRKVNLISPRRVIVLIVLILLFATVGYSYWHTELKIGGTVTAKLEKIIFSITYNNIENSSNYPSTIVQNTRYETTFTGIVPKSITVSMGGTELSNGTGFTYNNGTLIIPNVTGNLIINGVNNSSYSTNILNSTSDRSFTLTFSNMTFENLVNTSFEVINNTGKKIKSINFKINYNSSASSGTTTQNCKFLIEDENGSQLGVSSMNIPLHAKKENYRTNTVTLKNQVPSATGTKFYIKVTSDDMVNPDMLIPSIEVVTITYAS